MREKDIENLIARHPEEFFPGQGFRLTGQQVRLGTCYADIIFTDKHDRIVIIEIKRGLLTRDAAGQIMEYYGLLKQQQPDKIVELVLCANIIPPERREFLERAGIECKELGISLIQTIAQRHRYQFSDEEELLPRNKATPSYEARIANAEPTYMREGKKVWLFQADPNRYNVISALSDPALGDLCWQVNQRKKEIKQGDVALIWMSGKEAGIYAITDVTSDPEIRAEISADEKYWVNEEDRGTRRLRVTLSLRRNLVNRPLLRYELKQVDSLKHLSILRQAQGTNFPVSSIEWDVIHKKIDEKHNQA